MKFKKILHHNKLSYYDNNNADDELSLIHPKNKKVKIAYGTLPGGKIKHISAKYDDGNEVCERKSGLFGLFRYSTKSDKLLMFVGILFSVAHGFGFPLLALVFGQMTNTFVIQATQGTHSSHSIVNSTVNEFVKTQSDIVSSTTMVSTSIYPSETPTFEEKFGGVPLSSDEFTAYMSRYSLYYLCIGLAVLTTAFAQTICWELAAESQVQHLHTLFFGQVLRQDIGWYDVRSRSSGDLTVKLADDLERIREGIGSKFSMVIQYVSTFFSGITVGLIANWRLTCAILCVGPFLIGASAYVARYTASVAAREQLKYSIAGGVAEEVLNAIRTVAAFGGESKEIKRYDRALDEGRRMAMSKYYIMSSGVAIVFFLMYASFGFAFWYGAQLVAGGISTPGSVFTVFFSVMAGAFSIGNALPFLNAVGTAIGAASTIFGVIDRIPNIDPYSRKGYIPKKPNSITGTTGHIIFNGVYFSYPARPEVQVLNGLNMEIPTGKTVALVGTSGAGKSTIVSLLLRFYDPTCGEVLLDGVPLKDYNLRWLRNQIGVVSQEPVLFGMSIEDNIKFGCGGIVGDGDDDDVNNVSKLTTADVIKAAELANAHKFIKALPNGYKTMVGDRGAQLSGGQKQRIAIARAIVRDPKILLLDEATSALDAHSEGIVQDALDQAMKGRTTIIIAHRLSTIRNANVIYTFKNGVIAEAGDHNELMSMRGLYHNLVMTQVATTPPDVDVNTENNNVDNSLVLKTKQSENNEEVKTEWKKMEFGYQSSGFLKTINNIKESKHDLNDDQNEKSKLKETDTSGSLMWRLFKLNAPEWCWLLAGILGCALTGFIMPVFAFFYGEVFSTFTLEGEEMKSATMFWTMMFFCLAFFSAFAFFVQIISMTTAAEKLVARIRLITFQNLLRQSVGWFDVETNSPGRLITRLARDAPLIKHVSGLRAGHLVSVSVTLATAVCIAFLYGWKLASLLLIGVPLIAGASYKQTQIIRRSQLRDFKLMDSAGRVATECVSNVKTVQSLSKEKMFLKLYADYLVVPFKEAKKHALIYSVVFSLSQAIIFVMYAAAFRFGAYLIQIGDMTPTDVYRVFFALAFCATTAGQISAYIRDYNKARYASECLFKLIETKSEIDSDSSIGIRPVIHGKVTFDSVHFKYLSRPDYNVLRGISFTVEPGQTLALVGESGCGKSTIISLLERFYDPIQGKVMIDDFNTRSINIKHLRNNIGLVTQEPVLFNCSIKENILYGVQSTGENDDIIDMDNVIRAAKAANIHNFIVNLPQGYDTQVGRGGCKLSGGQKQRIAIARALIRDPKILLLDEATSALDTESEKIVQEALDYARRGRTCITVAHRLSTIQNADIIAVLHHGVIVEQGTHEELFNKQQRYYQLIKRQSI